MNFDEKLNAIFTLLNCSNSKIAKASGIDSSLVSRFRTGARVPRVNSSQFLKLCDGILSYAMENSLWVKLKDACGLAGTGNPKDEIYAYLLPPSHKVISNHQVHKPKLNAYPFFGEKLNALMNMLDISNIRLARSLNVDSSLISRFRNGLRTPPKNSQLLVNLCTYFYNRVILGGFENELSELLNISKPMVVNGGDSLITYFIDWISDTTEAQDTGAMDSFLEKLDSFTVDKNLQLPPVNIIATPDILNETACEYVGIDGFRHAIIRFLGSVATSNQPRTLKLYSDQNMEWLTTDTGFIQKWAALMYAVLLKKNRIKIIHHIDRGLPEMLVGIEKWLPLYMTGMIEAFYCNKTSDSRFTNTSFVAPQLAAITANFVAGTENTGKYQYSSTLELISYSEAQFDALMEMSKPLLQVFSDQNSSEYHFCIGEMAKQQGQVKKLILSPSIATMPKCLLEKILIRNKTDPTLTEKILILHNTCVKQFKMELQSGGVIEYLALPDDERLFSEKIELNLYNLFLSKPITYTTEEFSEHICAIVSLLNEYDSYHLVPLPDSPFSSIQMIVKSGTGAMILKSEKPAAAFWFGHPIMCLAFNEYLDSLSQKSKIPFGNKSSLMNLLKKYLI